MTLILYEFNIRILAGPTPLLIMQSMAYKTDYVAIIIPIQELSNSTNEYHSCSPKDSRLLRSLFEKFSIALNFEWITHNGSVDYHRKWIAFETNGLHRFAGLNGSGKPFVNFSHMSTRQSNDLG